MSATYYDLALSEIMVTEGLITPDRLSRLLGERENATESIGDMLVRVGLLTEQDRVRFIGKQLGIPYVNLAEHNVDTNTCLLINGQTALRLWSLPFERTATNVTVAMVNPLDINALDELKALTGLEVEAVITSKEDIQEAVGRIYGNGADNLSDLVVSAMKAVGDGSQEELEKELLKESEDAHSVLTTSTSPVIRLANEIFLRAIQMRTSDIHINPEKDRVLVRYRIDGMLREVIMIPKDLQLPLTSRLKIMASMDIAERRAPQDGRISLKTPQGEFDFRVSSYPSVHGENVVIRILDKRSAMIALDKVGMPPHVLFKLKDLIERPYGMIIVCGPTGSGKTTTLYGCLNALNAPERNIMTIEDPVEYQLTGIIQGNVNAKAGVTFASGLRTLVRQDPDVILVGEIRDSETAKIAIEAALTGHLVLSTLHANDSAGAITRLTEMGVEPFLIASSLVASLTQRLLRVNCPRCAAPFEPSPEVLDTIGVSQSDAINYQFRRGAGCDHCNQTGYRGRTGIYELLEIDEGVQRMILARTPSPEIKNAFLGDSGQLRHDALRRLRDGITTPEEVMRVTIQG
jgi:type IV pilus assembly protein PilB